MFTHDRIKGTGGYTTTTTTRDNCSAVSIVGEILAECPISDYLQAGNV